jgi:histidinol-phosphate aminotransferase
MNRYLNNFKKSVRAIKAYNLKERDCRIKLNQNENPYDLPDQMKSGILAELSQLEWNRYPTFYNTRLKTRLAGHVNLAPENILIGNGSNELLQITCNTVLEKGSKILLVTPTFTVYQQLARVGDADIVEVEFDEHWFFPIDRIRQQVSRDDIRLTVLCSPNSPTGSLLAEDELVEILTVANGLVLVDEAYHEFSQMDYLALLQDFPNLIITRTFSKAMGLAGLRIGYLMAHEELIVEINKGKLPYNLNIFSELVASNILDNYDYVRDIADKLVAERERVYGELQNIDGIRAFPSAANFLMFSTEYEADSILERVLAADVLIRDISGYHPRLAKTLRLSIGTPEENDTVLAVLHTIFENK